MDSNTIGKLTFEIAPGALKQIIASGRLAEFASKAAAHAAAQINAQVVDLVSKAALEKGSIARGVSVGFTTIFDGGDFGTGPIVGPKGPRPHIAVAFGDTGLSQIVAITGRDKQF